LRPEHHFHPSKRLDGVEFFGNWLGVCTVNQLRGEKSSHADFESGFESSILDCMYSSRVSIKGTPMRACVVLEIRRVAVHETRWQFRKPNALIFATVLHEIDRCGNNIDLHFNALPAARLLFALL
jgi:hypothetical protein